MNGGLAFPAGACRCASLPYTIITILAISAGILAGLALFGTTLPAYGPSLPLPLPVDALCAAIAAGAYAVLPTVCASRSRASGSPRSS